MAVAFNDSQISKWAQAYEKELCTKFDFIVDRVSINIIAGTGEYEIPNYVTNIRSVLYLGKELHAKSGRTSILTGDIPFASSQSAPYEYQTNGMGLRVIKLLPTPGDNIPVYSGDLFTVEADKAACILEFVRTPSYDTYDRTKLLPNWIRRYLLKDYVCWKAFSSEGPAQDLRGSTYYEQRRQLNEFYAAEINSNLRGCYQNVLSDNKMVGRRKPGHPVLPPNFGFPTYGG